MDDRPSEPAPLSAEGGGRLESWKAIASYLNRDVTTAQRWERREGMPVHRHLHDKQGTVYAFREELDGWLASRRVGAAGSAASEPAPVRPEPPGGIVAAGAVSRRRGALWLIPVAAAAVLLTAGLRLLHLPGDALSRLLDGATLEFLTEFEGSERAAAISRDGIRVAFLSDRAGQPDVWVTSPDGLEPENLTRGRMPRLGNDSVRSLGFTADGRQILFWAQAPGSARQDIGIWAIPVTGGEPVPYLPGAAELDWTLEADRLVYHTTDDGDPLFVRDRAQPEPRLIHAAVAGRHVHYPTWSPDGASIYVVQGEAPAAMDIWRIDPRDGSASQITHHQSRVSHPAFLDARTLLYLASDRHGGGPALWAFDLGTRRAVRLGDDLDQFTSLSASQDGRRLVLTAVHPRTSLWRVPIAATPDTAAPAPIPIPTSRSESPRFARDGLLYVAVSRSGDAIWRLSGGSATRWLTLPGGHVAGRPVVRADGQAVAFVVDDRGQTRLCVVDGDGQHLRVVATDLRVSGDPAWGPDGRTLTVAGERGGIEAVFSVPVEGGSPAVLVAGPASDPVWSPDGRLLAYTGRDVGTTFPLVVVTASGAAHPMPPVTLTRGARRLRFLDDRTLVILQGTLDHKDFWLHDLDTGRERQLTALPRGMTVHDFDLRPGGSEIVFDVVRASADIVLIERPGRQAGASLP